MLVDEIGFAQLSMGLVAERLGVKTPSLYKHLTGQADLAHRIAILAVTELGDAIRDATQGRAYGDALAAAAQAMRTYVREHPGRYAAVNSARPDGPDDPFIPASNRALSSSRPCCADTTWTPPRRSTPCGCCAACCTGSRPSKSQAASSTTQTPTTASPG